MNIGFIGLGRMGTGMASRLLSSGTNVLVYNRTAEKASALRKQGATVAKSLHDFADVDIVFTMLADDRALESTVLGDKGILQHLPSGAIHVSCSTISPDLTSRLTQVHAQAGQHFIAAPVFGRPNAAQEGKLFLILAGNPDILAQIEPLLARIGQRSFVIGKEPVQASLAKLAGNFLIATVIESLGESFAFVEKGGIDPHAFLHILTESIFNVPLYKNYGEAIVAGKFSPPGFAAVLGQKDIRLLLQAGETLQIPLPIASLLRDRFLRLTAQSGGDLDWSAIASLATEDAGLLPRTQTMDHGPD